MTCWPFWKARPLWLHLWRLLLRLHLWPGTGQTDYYEDDGATQAHTRGASRLTRFNWKAGGAGATLKWGASAGDYREAREDWTFVFHALPGMKAELDGKAVRAQREGNTLRVTVPDDGAAHTLRLIHRAR